MLRPDGCCSDSASAAAVALRADTSFRSAASSTERAASHVASAESSSEAFCCALAWAAGSECSTWSGGSNCSTCLRCSAFVASCFLSFAICSFSFSSSSRSRSRSATAATTAHCSTASREAASRAAAALVAACCAAASSCPAARSAAPGMTLGMTLLAVRTVRLAACVHAPRWSLAQRTLALALALRGRARREDSAKVRRVSTMCAHHTDRRRHRFPL